jgi:hypothetical protein
MAEEFIINSNAIESKINQLLPSQGGFQPGVDFSASTMVIPIVDITETAEGSNVRADLQTSFGYNGTNAFGEVNTTDVVIINTTGYYKIMYSYNPQGADFCTWKITDGVTPKNLIVHQSASGNVPVINELNVFLGAGDSITLTTGANGAVNGSFRQIADIDGNLINPN